MLLQYVVADEVDTLNTVKLIPIKIILNSEDFLFKLVIEDEEVLIIKIFSVSLISILVAHQLFHKVEKKHKHKHKHINLQ